jgi:Uncharacterized protein conserved in bacteria (DUF2188)
MADVHVVPSGEVWALQVDGEKRDTFSTQNEAITRGRQLAEEQQGELVIHGEDGEIREKASHGNDPRDIHG